MKFNIYTIYDSKAEECGPLFESKNDQTALRAYKQFINKEVGRPDEYKLMLVGEYDHEGMQGVFKDFVEIHDVYLAEEVK